MARWRLKDKHYLNIEGTEWEYRETGGNGRQKRMVFAVPLHLDPDMPADWNSPDGIVVSDGNNPGPRDLIFTGPPTPDMEPLDAEAEAISEAEGQKRGWYRGPQVGPGDEAYGGKLISQFLEQMNAINMTKAPSSPIPDGPTMEQFETLMAENRKLSEQVAQLVAAQAPPVELTGEPLARRV